MDERQIWTGNLVAINGSTINVINSRTIDATLVNYLYLPNLVEFNLQGSNLKQVATILKSELQNLKILNLSRCTGMVSSKLSSADSFNGLSYLGMFFCPSETKN